MGRKKQDEEQPYYHYFGYDSNGGIVLNGKGDKDRINSVREIVAGKFPGSKHYKTMVGLTHRVMFGEIMLEVQAFRNPKKASDLELSTKEGREVGKTEQMLKLRSSQMNLSTEAEGVLFLLSLNPDTATQNNMEKVFSKFGPKVEQEIREFFGVQV